MPGISLIEVSFSQMPGAAATRAVAATALPITEIWGANRYFTMVGGVFLTQYGGNGNQRM
jgi:hypothetical protein